MAGQITTSVTIINSGLKGYQALTLTNYTGSAVSAIAAGSSVEIAGAFFLFSSEESVTGFSAITTANTAYVALTPSGTAGSQIVSASWTETAPTWSESKQGWYTSTDSVIRVVGGGLKTGTASIEPKWMFTPAIQNSRSLVLGGPISPRPDPTVASQFIASGGEWIPDIGVYTIGSISGFGTLDVQIYSGGSFVAANRRFVGGTIVVGAANTVRLREVSSGGTVTLYYAKF